MSTDCKVLEVQQCQAKLREWLDDEGCIAVEQVALSQGVVRVSSGWFGAIYRAIISPVFLTVMISVLLVIPRALLKYHRNFFRRLLCFSKHVLKRSLDVVGALFGLIASLAVFIFLPILIKLDSSGSVIFKQKRVGRNRRRKRDRRSISLEVPFERRKDSRRKDNLLGKPFYVYKFRSMRQDAELKTGPVWATDNDPRVTNVGRVLRSYHIDEIPQFVNVLRGEMSLVGPRPERPEFTKKLKAEIPHYERRFMRKPGLTGLAQIICGYDTSTENVNNKLRFDLHYINNFNLITDLKILWGTAKKILLGKDKLEQDDIEKGV